MIFVVLVVGLLTNLALILIKLLVAQMYVVLGMMDTVLEDRFARHFSYRICVKCFQCLDVLGFQLNALKGHVIYLLEKLVIYADVLKL
jgi:uncharacterized protein (UPF0548 family)